MRFAKKEMARDECNYAIFLPTLHKKDTIQPPLHGALKKLTFAILAMPATLPTRTRDYRIYFLIPIQSEDKIRCSQTLNLAV